MATGNVMTLNAKKIMLNRAFKAVPDYTAPTVFSVGTGTTTPTPSDTALANRIQINGSDTKAFITGYPVLDETAMACTIRGLVATTDCNGNSLTEFGLYNTDGTPKLFSRMVHTAITKTASVQVIYLEKDKIVI